MGRGGGSGVAGNYHVGDSSGRQVLQAEIGAAAGVVALLVRFWPALAGVAIFGCVISYLVEFSIYDLDALYVMSLNDLAFKSSQNLIWFFSISLYVVAVAFLVGLTSKLPPVPGAVLAILIMIAAVAVFTTGADLTHVWNRYVLYRLEGLSRWLGLDLIHLAPSERQTAEAEIAWSRTHYVRGIRADAFAWFSIASLAVLAVVTTGLATRWRAVSNLPMLAAAIVAPLITLNASLGVDRAMLLDPKIAALEGQRGYEYLTLPGGLQERCPTKGVLLWHGEKTLVVHCPANRTNFIYLRDFSSIVFRNSK